MKIILILFSSVTLLLTSCGVGKLDVTVTNTLGFKRTEVVSVKATTLSRLLKGHNKYDLRISRDGQGLPLQWLEWPDGTTELLFMADVAANGNVVYKITNNNSTALPYTAPRTFGRFVPERSDDFAWENDKVAFRVYGPKGQREAIEGVPGSTLGSGVDIWLKRTDKLVINSWYAGHVKQPGYYHTDRGEGYDPYHMGDGRGTGGIGIWINDSLQVSQNFTGYRVIANGPLRTVFELDYGPWSDYAVHETKRITIDAGSNFSKFDISLSAEKPVPDYAIGISLHGNGDKAGVRMGDGIYRHWEKIDDAWVGEGIVVNPAAVSDAVTHVSKTEDQSQLLVIAKPTRLLSYYAGFAWQKSGQVSTVNDWDVLLSQKAQGIAKPLEVIIK